MIHAISATCKRGHVMTSDNTITWDGRLYCKDCERHIRNTKRWMKRALYGM